MKFITVIGLEVHVQLLTRSKLFCGCANLFNPDHPNVQTCPVCLGMPGSLPVMNRRAFQLALRTALALNSEIAPFTKWDRKQYFYPDLPKGYQISQYDLPFSYDGWLEFAAGTGDEATEKKRVRLIRVHLEDDAGKNIHDESGGGRDSVVDLNRAGTPLLEIVTQPDINSPQQARQFLEELRLLLTYLEVSDCNMQEGSLRCDANVNLHVHTDDGHKIATPIVEIKNLNSFRGVEAALEYEIARQVEEWKNTRAEMGDVPKQTRGWDANRGVTFAQRGKEEASDYRYFPDPDLVPVTVSDDDVEEIRETLCERPSDRRSRFVAAYELSPYDAAVIIDQGPGFADYFEDVAQGCGNGKQAANWVTQDVLREMNDRKLAINEFPVLAEHLIALLKKILDGKLTIKSGREVFTELLADEDAHCEITTARIDEIIEAKGLAIVSDTGKLEEVIDAVIATNSSTVDDVRGGKDQAVGPLVGKVMRELKGADPKTVRAMLLERIRSS